MFETRGRGRPARPGSIRCALVGLGLLAAATPAAAQDIFELERTTLQRRMDEAWRYSVESRLRRGGLHMERTGESEQPTMFAMSWLNEFGPTYDAMHLTASMLQFFDVDGVSIGHGPLFGFSRMAAQASQEDAVLSGFGLQDAEARLNHVFAGWNVGSEAVFLELGWRWRWMYVDHALLERLDPETAAPYLHRPSRAHKNTGFAKLRWGGESFGLWAFLEPGGSVTDPAVAYLEPEYRVFFDDDGALMLDSRFSYRRVNVSDNTPRARLAFTEVLQLGRIEHHEDGQLINTDRAQIRMSVENFWAPDAMGTTESLGSWDHYVLRVETEPYYVGAWYNPAFGFGWGLGLAGVSEWAEDGTTMRVVLRYVRNYIQPEPTANPVTPWLFEFSATAGF